MKFTRDIKLYLRLLGYVTPYWRVFLLSVLGMVLLAFTNPATAALFKYMVAGVFLLQDADRVPIIITALISLFAVAALAGYVSSLSLSWVANKVVMNLRMDLFRRLLLFPSRFYDNHSAGSLVSKFTYDVIQIKEASTNVLSVMVRDTLTITGLLAWMLYVDWEMTLIALLAAPLILILLFIIRLRLRKMSHLVQESMGEINHILGEVIDGQRIIKLFGGQEQEQQRFLKAINDNRHFNMKFASASLASSPTVQLITAIAMAIIIYVSAQKAGAGTFGVDDFVSFFTAVLMMLGPLKRLVRINEYIQRGLAACESVFGLMDELPEKDAGKLDSKILKGNIEISNLNFSYDDNTENVLSNISISVKPGETIAIVGASGSGKTTLADLLARFYTNDSGQILIDNNDIRELSLASLRSNIGLVSQDIILFNNTIRYNIAYGEKRDASDQEIIDAATEAHAMEFINLLPDGLDTLIGDKGTRLSGGQRQRVALARALLKQAPILILDEATSALDTESERHIQLALETIRKHHTCIIIAHRLSTIESADRVIVLRGGKIEECGTHQELLEKNGIYASLYLNDSNEVTQVHE